MILRTVFVLALSLMLAACGKSGAPDITLVPVAVTPAPTPAECDPAKDPKWTHLPERRVTVGDWPALVRQHDANLQSFETVEARRRACHAVLEARKSSSSPAKE